MTAAHFPVENLPFGAFSRDGDGPRVGVALGDAVIDLASAAASGALGDEGDLVAGPTLNPLLAAGPTAWSALRSRIRALIDDGDAREHLVPAEGVTLHLPFEVQDYVDFYSSIEHATNLGRMMRPDGDPLLPNWRHLPVGYHGRSSTVVVSGTPIQRPKGQTKAPDAAAPSFGPCRMLDFELEVGFVTGPGNALGEPIDVADAETHIFGIVLVNDWSARDIQSWEYQPLGPFLAKSFATSVSPWVVPLATFAPYRVPGPEQEPRPFDYLKGPEPRGLDLRLEVWLRTSAMVAAGSPAVRITATSFAAMYWSMAQQLAHLTVNGAVVRPGDLCASGTVSGAEPGSEGSLIELTRRGSRPLTLPNGETRAFLEDGDEVIMTGWCGGEGGRPRVGLGTVTGRVAPADG